MSSTPSASRGGLSALIQAYKDSNEAAGQAVMSQSGDQSFGSQTLSQVDKSVKSAFEPGTALVRISCMSSCPDYLVCTDGHIEPVTDPMSRAWEFKNREAFLANRVLHSLDGQSVLMSDEDYEAVRGLVSAAMADTGEQASRIIRDYSKALESLEEARKRQLETSQVSTFTLDLSKQPYSMRRQTKPSWPRDFTSRVFRLWAWSRLQESAKVYWNAREIEDECFDPNAMPLKHVHLQSCGYNKDDDSVRFQRTDHHLMDLWRNDVLLISLATGRSLTADETLSLMPLPLYQDFSQHHIEPITNFNESKITRKKPSNFLAMNDPEWKSWLQEIITTLDQKKRFPNMSELPVSGYESLISAVKHIQAGKGKDFMRSRYGEKSQPVTINKYFENIDPLQRFMATNKSLGSSNLTDDEVVSRLSSKAYHRWKEISGARKGLSIKGMIRNCF